MENAKQKAVPTYDTELKTWTILFSMGRDSVPLGKTVSKGEVPIFEYCKFDTSKEAQEWINKHSDKFYYEIPVRFYQFNGFPYALIAIENNCTFPIDVAINEYKNSVFNIKNENNYYPVELTIDESLELYKHEHINALKNEDEKIENFFKLIDFDKYKTINDTHSAILLIDKNFAERIF